MAPQCDYEDAAECRQRALKLSGICSLNSSAIALSPGSGLFCVVNSTRTSQCIYDDRFSCENTAQSTGGICVNNDKAQKKSKKGKSQQLQQDPFKINPERNY
jgi:phosphatidylinositol kinase/protein kinase (PI-3  family)